MYPIAEKELTILARLVAREINATALTDRWLTMDEARTYAKVSTNTIKKWLDEGRIYGTRTTGSWRIDRESIDDFFNMER